MDRRNSAWVALGLAAILVLAVGLRALLHPQVMGDEGIFFERGDSQYHLRRAYYTFRNFPSVLMRDAYINYPDGAPIPWPPLYDFAIGTAARLVAIDDRGFERVAAWVNPVIGALTCIPVFLVGRRLRSPSVGLGGAALQAVFPVGVLYSHVGNVDHHAFVALLGACLLAACVRAADPRVESSGAVATLLGLALARSAMMLAWHGSFLYLAAAEAGLFAVAAATGRSRLLAMECASLLATLAVIAPVVAVSPTALGGPFSAIALSWLHVLVLAVLALVAGAVPWIAPDGCSTRRRFAALAALGFAGAALLLASSGVRGGLEPALRFVSMTDAMGMQTAEQRPLLPLGAWAREPAFPPLLSLGFLAFALPFAPFVVAWLQRRPGPTRAPGLLLAAWTGLFTLLAIGQYRYANDLGPAASVSFALWIAAGIRRIEQRGPLRGRIGPSLRSALAVAIGLALLAPPVASLYGPWVGRSWLAAGDDARARVDPVHRSLRIFLEAVRVATPETSGFVDAAAKPEYGVVADADLGHAIQFLARRPTPTDPFWSYIGERNWAEAHALLQSPDEASAATVASVLHARYVVTIGRAPPGTLAHRLHFADGLPTAASPARPYGGLRLVTEGPRGGVGLPGTRAQAGIPYKLFEFVAGAKLAVEAPAGSRVEARARIRTASGRHFVYETRVSAGSDGVARLRLPYASESPGPTRPTGPWSVRASGGEARVHLSEADVVEGRELALEAAAFTRRAPRSGE